MKPSAMVMRRLRVRAVCIMSRTREASTCGEWGGRCRHASEGVEKGEWGWVRQAIEYAAAVQHKTTAVARSNSL